MSDIVQSLPAMLFVAFLAIACGFLFMGIDALIKRHLISYTIKRVKQEHIELSREDVLAALYALPINAEKARAVTKEQWRVYERMHLLSEQNKYIISQLQNKQS